MPNSLSMSHFPINRSRRSIVVVFSCLHLGASAATPPTAAYAHYMADAGLDTDPSGSITRWVEQTGVTARDLDRIIGVPKAVTYSHSGGGSSNVVVLDGNSALWATATNWGSVSTDRSVIVRARLKGTSNGFLFDGSTASGKTRAQVNGGNWQAGVQSTAAAWTSSNLVTTAIAANTWQTHLFEFEVNVSSTTVRHFIDGIDVGGGGNVALTTALGGLILGSNGGTSGRLHTELAEVLVYNRVLNTTEKSDVTTYLDEKWGDLVDLPFSLIHRTVLHAEDQDGVHIYRIPALVTTNAGTLIAGFDLRYNGAPGSAPDLPADIDIGIRRSTDGGLSWTPMQLIMDYDKNVAGSSSNGIADPTLLVDKVTGRIWCAALWSFGNRGWSGSGPGLTPAETGQFLLNYSDDDGLTWSEPVSITPQIKDPAWRIYFQGPGKGICLRDGTLVFPAQFKNGSNVAFSNMIYSKDRGVTWHNIAPAVPSGSPQTNEAQVVELDNGNLLMSMKNFHSSKQRLWCIYSWDHTTQTIDQGSWGTPWFSQNDPTVQGSVERYRSVLDGHPYSALLFANPDSATSRSNMSVRISLDEGLTWPYKRSIDTRPAAYSCMTILPDGEIGMLYETGDTSSISDLVFSRFPIEWIIGSEDTDNDGIPDFHEDATGLDKTDAADALLDSDGDGQSNLSEYIAGTNPQDARSTFRILSFENDSPDGKHTLKWAAAAYRSYRVESSPSLAAGSWQAVPGLEAITNGSDARELAVELPVGADSRNFYRISTMSPP